MNLDLSKVSTPKLEKGKRQIKNLANSFTMKANNKKGQRREMVDNHKPGR